jgi:hypothetical protein
MSGKTRIWVILSPVGHGLLLSFELSEGIEISIK